MVIFFDILSCLFCNTNLSDFDMSKTEHHILLSFGCENQAEKFTKILSCQNGFHTIFTPQTLQSLKISYKTFLLYTLVLEKYLLFTKYCSSSTSTLHFHTSSTDKCVLKYKYWYLTPTLQCSLQVRSSP